MLDHNDLREVIWERFPEVRPVILNLDTDGGVCSHYTWVSEAFWWPLFEPALREDQDEVLQRCFGLVEDMLGGDEQLREVTEIRVVPYLCSWPDQVRTMGGPLLHESVARQCDGPPGAGPDSSPG